MRQVKGQTRNFVSAGHVALIGDDGPSLCIEYVQEQLTPIDSLRQYRVYATAIRTRPNQMDP